MTSQRLSCFVVLALIEMGLTLSCLAAETNTTDSTILKNGNFRVNKQGTPDGWECTKETAEMIPTNPGYCLKIFSSQKGTDPTVVQQGIRLAQGQRYRLSYRVRAGGASDEVTGYQHFRVYTSYKPPVRKKGTYGGVSQQDGIEWQDAFEHWQGRSLEFRTPNKEFSTATVTCQVRGPGVLYFDDIKLERLGDPIKKTAIAIEIRSPWYRDTIFASTPIDQIQGVVTLDQAQTRRGTLQFLDPFQKCLYTRDFEKMSSIDFNIPARDLPTGDYHLLVKLLDERGNTIDENARIIHKMPHQPNEVVFRSDRVLLQNGKPWFPIGVWGMRTDEAYVYELSRAGVNTFIGVHEKASLDLVHRYGAKMLAIALRKLPHANDPENRRLWTQKYLDRYGALFNHPALLGYFLADEALWCGVPLDELLDSYDFHRRLNPYRPIFMNEAPRNTPTELAAYANACDITGVDIYPVPENSHSEMEDKSLSCVGKYTEKMRKVVADRKPIWMTLQGFSWIHLSKPGHPKAIYPTFQEMRFMAYDALIHGATGIFFWGTQHIVNSDFWDVLLKLTGELRDVSTILVSPTVTNSSFESNHPAIKILHKRCQGHDYFFIENAGKKTVKQKFTTRLTSRELTVLFEDRRVTLVDGSFIDTFEPFDVHIYTTAQTLPSSLVPLPGSDEKFEGKGFLKKMRTLSDNFSPYTGSANWIWLKSPSGESIREGFLIKEFTLSEPVRSAIMLLTADDTFTLNVNGQNVGDDRQSPYRGWSVMKRYNLTSCLKPGRNVLAVHVEDLGSDFCAGLLCDLTIKTIDNKEIRIKTDHSWLAAESFSDSDKDSFQKSNLTVQIIGPYGVDPWAKHVRIEPEK